MKASLLAVAVLAGVALAVAVLGVVVVVTRLHDARAGARRRVAARPAGTDGDVR